MSWWKSFSTLIQKGLALRSHHVFRNTKLVINVKAKVSDVSCLNLMRRHIQKMFMRQKSYNDMQQMFIGISW